jgi:tRNA A22 N-methylase
MIWASTENSKYAPLFRTAMKFGPELVKKKNRYALAKSEAQILESAHTPRIPKENKKRRTNRVNLRLQDIARACKTENETDAEEQMKTMAAG